MPILLKEDYEYSLPAMYRVQQCFESNPIADVEDAVICQMQKKEITDKIKPGSRVAVAVGSRGIRNLALIVKTVVACIKEAGGQPFIVSAMGSHGSGTEEGQREVLTGYGITEEAMGVPVVTKVDVVKLGETKAGIPVYFDEEAYGADLIVPVNRVKLHTDFVADLQSGMCKMLVIGLGNHKGCSSIHEQEPEQFGEILEEAASMIIEKTPVGFGIAILEDSYDKTSMIEAVPAEKIIEREKELVKIARKNMPYIMLDHIDVLVVEEIGKDISGAGYDPNILGRSPLLKTFVLHVPKFQKMVLLGLSRGTHGNAVGMGLFDVITKNVFEEADLESVYANAIAVKSLEDAKVPLMAQNEDEAVRVAIKTCRDIDMENLRIARIKNTLELEYIYVSEAMLDEVEKNDRLILQQE